ncbi:hypothetical protein pEaSNUABM29_00147 [Erwinia phage pEa_SNUABM_29]|nr:hypothetical protein pEaSNUABM29_00147 [Erwinia phage pEa_SNUABM_29]
MLERSHFLIPEYLFLAGPLTELPPNDILREVNDDLNGIINTAMQFVQEGTVGELKFMMNGTFNYVARELNALGVILENDQVITYGAAIQSVGRAYMTAVSSSPYWFTHYGRWVAAQYTTHDPSSVEFLLDYSQGLKFPDWNNPQAYEHITPQLLPVIDLLIGNLGGVL